ncbi:MAG: GGDEF domain-containing phosphodiesterase [Pseudomonadota bacterium]
MFSRPLATIMVIALAATMLGGLGLTQLATDSAKVAPPQRLSQPMEALHEALLPGVAPGLSKEEFGRLVRAVEVNASTCLDDLSGVTRWLLGVNGQGAVLGELCAQRAALARAVLGELQTLPAEATTFGALTPSTQRRLGALVSQLWAHTHRFDGALSGAFTLAVWLVQAALATMSAMVVLVAAFGLLRARGALGRGRSRARAFGAVTDAPLPIVDRSQLRSRLQRVIRSTAFSSPGDASATLYFFSVERPEWDHGDGGDARGWQEALQAAGQRLANTVREDDMAMILESDELVLLARRVGDTAQATQLGERLLDKLRGCGDDTAPTIHGGFAIYPQDAEDADNFARYAQRAMREATRQGPNRIVCYCSKAQAKLDERALIETALRDALARNELTLAYQPVINVAEGKSFSVEALLRWQHPELGSVPPGKFIPIAEESRLILALGEWVLDQAMRQVREWRDGGRNHVRVSVNISPRQLLEQDLASLVAQTLERYELPGDALLLELTETVLVTERERASQVLDEVRRLGVGVVLDDFGSGYSSLGYLTTMPLDLLKIDRSFLREPSADQRAIIHTIVGLARTLGVRVVAEGVEDGDAANFVRDAGCHFVQGFLFSRPVPPQAIGWHEDYSHLWADDGDLAPLVDAS